MLRRLKRLIFNRKKEEDSEVQIGKNVDIINSYIDSGFGWLITIGDNVTITNATILAHDASTKKSLGYTKVGRVDIGDNVFIGAESVILPGVTIGHNVIIGANSTVIHSVPDNSVYSGSPAKFLCSLDDYLMKEQRRMEKSPCYGEEFTLRKKVSLEKRIKQKKELKGKIGYIV